MQEKKIRYYRIIVYLETRVEYFYYRTLETIEELDDFLLQVLYRYNEGNEVFEVDAIEL